MTVCHIQRSLHPRIAYGKLVVDFFDNSQPEIFMVGHSELIFSY